MTQYTAPIFESKMPARDHLYKSEAIVIKRIDLGEADKILTIFTPHFGKLRVVAKGVRKVTSRLAGHVELFTRNQMLLAKARNLDIITQSETIDGYRPLHEDLTSIAYASYASELLDALMPDELESYPVYKLLADTLSLISEEEHRDRTLRWFELQFLGYLGLLHARQSRHKDARHCLDSGEALLRSVSDRLGLGVHLTSLAEARQLAGDAATARASLAAATAIAAEVGAGPTSEIGLALARVRALIESG